MLSKQPDFLNGRDPTGKKIAVLMAKLLVADSDIRKMLNIFTSLMARIYQESPNKLLEKFPNGIRYQILINPLL